ncbi:hypothetical protein SFRURICE_000506 [Spodoptera frugiperda]|nr:hypothetical protein SFRURICE_000506 [Spodoptera frugiperda]
MACCRCGVAAAWLRRCDSPAQVTNDIALDYPSINFHCGILINGIFSQNFSAVARSLELYLVYGIRPTPYYMGPITQMVKNPCVRQNIFYKTLPHTIIFSGVVGTNIQVRIHMTSRLDTTIYKSHKELFLAKIKPTTRIAAVGCPTTAPIMQFYREMSSVASIPSANCNSVNANPISELARCKTPRAGVYRSITRLCGRQKEREGENIPCNAKRKCIATETRRERWKRQFAESPGNVVTRRSDLIRKKIRVRLTAYTAQVVKAYFDNGLSNGTSKYLNFCKLDFFYTFTIPGYEMQPNFKIGTTSSHLI